MYHKNIDIRKPTVNPTIHLLGPVPGNKGVVKKGTIKKVNNE
jgi:hypothetical protein